MSINDTGGASTDSSMLPRGWEQARLKDVLPIEYGKSLPAKERHDGDVPVYGSSGQVGNHNTSYTKCPALIVGRKGNVGSIHYSSRPCWPIDTVYFAPATPSVDLRFFHHQLKFLTLI